METASKKERFELCVAMLRGYYEALEGRLDKTVALLVVVIGWIVSSERAREVLQKDSVLFWLAAGILTVIVMFYCGNVVHWIARWRQIQASADGLAYVEADYYSRYRLSRGRRLALAYAGYLAPVAFLYLFIVMCLALIRAGGLAS